MYPYEMSPIGVALVCLVLVALVPLFVLGATGSWRHALHALREYAVAMGLLLGVPAVVALAMVAAERI